jgi:hypothetical protein
MQGWSTISSHASRWLGPADPVAARSWHAGGADIRREKELKLLLRRARTSKLTDVVCGGVLDTVRPKTTFLSGRIVGARGLGLHLSATPCSGCPHG